MTPELTERIEKVRKAYHHRDDLMDILAVCDALVVTDAERAILKEKLMCWQPELDALKADNAKLSKVIDILKEHVDGILMEMWNRRPAPNKKAHPRR